MPIELLDVAGLVPGAHEGKGLGNKFLDDLRHADALVHVVDVSGTTDAEGEPYTFLIYHSFQLLGSLGLFTQESMEHITDTGVVQGRRPEAMIHPKILFGYDQR